jgi:hypothetical protein
MHADLSGSWRRGYWFLLGATVLCVALADWLFYGHTLGWSAALFTAALMTALALRGGGFMCSGAGRAVAAAAGGIVAALVEEPTPIAILLAALAVMMLAVLNRNRWPGGAREWAARLAEAIGVALTKVVTDNRLVARWFARHPLSLGGPARAATVWALPLALGAVFVLLFRAANPVFANLVGRAADWLGDMLANVAAMFDLPRNVFWLTMAAVVYALLRVRRCRRQRTGRPPLAVWEPEEVAARRSAFARAVVVRSLLLFNALFALQNLLDVMYLFGGATLPEGMDYAQYAHRGAYPLVATALLAAAFVLAAFRPGGAAEKSVLARRLVYGWVAQNVFLTVTAAWRLDLYVGAYSLTRMRLAAGVWMLLVAAGLVWIGCRIVFRRDNAWLLNANVLTAAALLYAGCFVIFDRVIADFNVAHCREAAGEGAALDLDYLRGLGPDALPALRRAGPLLPPGERRSASVAYADDLEQELRAELSDWRGWTLRRARLSEGAGAAPGPAEFIAGSDDVVASAKRRTRQR